MAFLRIIGQLCVALILASMATTKACEVSSGDKEAMRNIIMALFNALQDKVDFGTVGVEREWFETHTSVNVSFHIQASFGELVFKGQDNILDPQTGVWAVYELHFGEGTQVITAGANLEFTCQAEEGGIQMVSVIVPWHQAIHSALGLIVDDHLMQMDFVFVNGQWLCVKIDLFLTEHELAELTGDVSMIEQYAVLDVITAWSDAWETAANTKNPCAINDWYKANAIAEVQLVTNINGRNWYSLEELLDYDNGVYATVVHSHMRSLIVFVGANLRYSSLTVGNERVIQVIAPVHMSIKSDQVSVTDDQLYLHQFVCREGRWLLKAVIAQVTDHQVSPS